MWFNLSTALCNTQKELVEENVKIRSEDVHSDKHIQTPHMVEVDGMLPKTTFLHPSSTLGWCHATSHIVAAGQRPEPGDLSAVG